jgi:nucleoside-diphosphate-sugar epimerase
MTALVTGATGLLGSHLTDLLLARGERPRVLILPDEVPPWSQGEVEICRGDLRDRGSLERAVKGVNRVFHCAARTGPWGDPREYTAVNVTGLRTLVQLSAAAGVGRFVHVSSITVHGNDVRGSADENAPYRLEPNPYSRSKVAGERLLAALLREQRIPVAIARPGWIYGPRDRDSFARFATMIARGRMIVVGSGENHLPLIYAGDAAHGLLLAAEAAGPSGRAYLLVNDELVTQREFLAAIAAELGVAAPARGVPYRLALQMGAAAEAAARLARRRSPPPLMRYGLQMLGGENRFVITRARRELGFAPQVGMREGVRRSVEWYRSTQLRAAA